MVWLLAAAATTGVVAAAVLFWPVTVELAVSKDAGSGVEVRAWLRWLGLSVPLHRAPKKEKDKDSASRRSRRSNRRLTPLLHTPGFTGRTARLIRELASLARPKQFDLNARVGFDDPSDTGVLLGCLNIGSIGGGAYRIHITPDFSDEVLEARLRARWSRSVATLVWPVLKYAASPVVWRAVRNYRAQPPGRAFASTPST